MDSSKPNQKQLSWLLPPSNPVPAIYAPKILGALCTNRDLPTSSHRPEDPRDYSKGESEYEIVPNQLELVKAETFLDRYTGTEAYQKLRSLFEAERLHHRNSRIPFENQWVRTVQLHDYHSVFRNLMRDPGVYHWVADQSQEGNRCFLVVGYSSCATGYAISGPGNILTDTSGKIAFTEEMNTRVEVKDGVYPLPYLATPNEPTTRPRLCDSWFSRHTLRDEVIFAVEYKEVILKDTMIKDHAIDPFVHVDNKTYLYDIKHQALMEFDDVFCEKTEKDSPEAYLMVEALEKAAMLFPIRQSDRGRVEAPGSEMLHISC